jgi:HTH-type transcriptional regulator/antitoxin HigA
MEEEADRFASESLIPEAFAARLAGVSSKADLVGLANKIGVAPGVLAGRYQHQMGAFNKYNELRRSMPVDLFT